MIRLLKKQEMSEEGSALHARADMRIKMSYLTLSIGFLPLKGTKMTSGGLISLRLPITSETRISSAPTIMRWGTSPPNVGY